MAWTLILGTVGRAEIVIDSDATIDYRIEEDIWIIEGENPSQQWGEYQLCLS